MASRSGRLAFEFTDGIVTSVRAYVRRSSGGPPGSSISPEMTSVEEVKNWEREHIGDVKLVAQKMTRRLLEAHRGPRTSLFGMEDEGRIG